MNFEFKPYAIDEKAYRCLLATARSVAYEILENLPAGTLSGQSAFIVRQCRALLASVAPIDNLDICKGAVYEALQAFRVHGAKVCLSAKTGEDIFREYPGLWLRLMREWPMGDYARMAVDFLIGHGLVGGNILELGAGVGNASILIGDHVGENYTRTDLKVSLLERLKLPGKIASFDFDKPGMWRNLDTVFAVNALHCATDKPRSIASIHKMLKVGGVLLMGEGAPVTDNRGTPWALTGFFGLFDGWWDIGGFLPRDQWLKIMDDAGFVSLGHAALVAGKHDLGGLVWGVKAG